MWWLHKSFRRLHEFSLGKASLPWSTSHLGVSALWQMTSIPCWCGRKTKKQNVACQQVASLENLPPNLMLHALMHHVMKMSLQNPSTTNQTQKIPLNNQTYSLNYLNSTRVHPRNAHCTPVPMNPLGSLLSKVVSGDHHSTPAQKIRYTVFLHDWFGFPAHHGSTGGHRWVNSMSFGPMPYYDAWGCGSTLSKKWRAPPICPSQSLPWFHAWHWQTMPPWLELSGFQPLYHYWFRFWKENMPWRLSKIHSIFMQNFSCEPSPAAQGAINDQHPDWEKSSHLK